jgi:hypothetical protein
MIELLYVRFGPFNRSVEVTTAELAADYGKVGDGDQSLMLGRHDMEMRRVTIIGKDLALQVSNLRDGRQVGIPLSLARM